MPTKNIAIITARGGSKRIPRKNIRPFLGKPIIAYSIEAALKSGLFDEVMVSTDDAEIAAIAKEYGATVPFMRSDENANDYAGTVDVLLEVLDSYKAIDQRFDCACCIYPTAPFVTSELLIKAFEKIKNEKLDCVFPVLPFSFPIQRALKLDKLQKMSMFYPEYLTARSQDLEKAYHDSGQFYFFRPAALQLHKRLYTENTAVIVLNEMQAHDIDNEEDWKVAEIKYQLMHGQG
ncbi:MAG: pseudaminic acid cytidylyltransferase [Flavobacteriales bacterium]